MKASSLLTFLSFFIPVFSFAQLSGVKTIPGDYPTIAAAVAAITAQGVPSNQTLTINVAAGHTETSTGIISLDLPIGQGTVTIQKSGAGTNPLITAYTGGTATPASSQQDGIFRICGAPGTVIDGI